MAGFIRIPLGTEVDLILGDTVLDGDPVSSPLKGHSPGWTKMPLGVEVGLCPGDVVLDGDPAPLPKRGTAPSFRPMFTVDATWYGSRPRPRPHCVRRGPTPSQKGHSSSLTLFSADVYCGHGRPCQLLLNSYSLAYPSLT